GASHAIDLQSQLDGLSSYASNVQDGISWATTSESAMANMGSVLQRVRELTLQASNGTNNQYAGQYVFAGTLTTTAPYQPGESDTYNGNGGAVARAIGPGASVTVNTNISSLLGSGKGAADGKLLDTLRTVVQNLREGTTESRGALSSTDLKALDANAEVLSQLQATAGSAIDQLQTASSRIEG